MTDDSSCYDLRRMKWVAKAKEFIYLHGLAVKQTYAKGK